MQELKRYGMIDVGKHDETEVVLLRTTGCQWGKCTFCDYHLDRCSNILENMRLNSNVLKCIKGSPILQVICSASWTELPATTMAEIKNTVVRTPSIRQVVFEGHWMYRESIAQLRELFAPIPVKVIIGLETLDEDYRENVLNKGMADAVHPKAVAEYFDWVNIMYGMPGQTLEKLEVDVDVCSRLFEKVTINMFVDNVTATKRDNALVEEFYQSSLFKRIITDFPQVVILDDADERAPHTLDGVGGKLNKEGK